MLNILRQIQIEHMPKASKVKKKVSKPKIKNVSKGDADYLKNYLIEHVNKPEFIFSYEWSKGDICLWDNLSILHMASEIKNCKRIMHRITIK